MAVEPGVRGVEWPLRAERERTDSTTGGKENKGGDWSWTVCILQPYNFTLFQISDQNEANNPVIQTCRWSFTPQTRYNSWYWGSDYFNTTSLMHQPYRTSCSPSQYQEHKESSIPVMLEARPVLCSALISGRKAAQGQRGKISDLVKDMMKTRNEAGMEESEICVCSTWICAKQQLHKELQKRLVMLFS